MKEKIKKISIVLYCNGDFEDTKESLYSILDQNISHLFYEVIIVNDNAKKNFTDRLHNFITKEELTNFHVYSLQFHNGLAMSFNFLLKNNIIKTKYLTIMKAGDTIADGWMDQFVNDLFYLNKDLYVSNLRDVLEIPVNKPNRPDVKYETIKSFMSISSGLTREITQEEVLSSKPVFLGKIWRTENVISIMISDNKILYQDIYMFMQMVMNCKTIWYEAKVTGKIKHKSWIPEKMDKERIQLLSLTLNKTISRNPYINGHILQLLALAITNTPKELLPFYLLSNHKYLQNNIIVPIYGMSQKKVIKLTKQFVEYGDWRKERTKETQRSLKKAAKKEEKQKRLMEKNSAKKTKKTNLETEKNDDFVLEHESYKI